MKTIDQVAVREFEAIVGAATPGPWTIRKSVSGDDRYNVLGNGATVEEALLLSFANYLVFVRTTSARLLEATHDGQSLGKAQITALSSETEAVFASVGADWVFVAPHEHGAYFLHNCLRRVGAGRLTREDALFIDAAKRLIPQLLADLTRSSRAAVPTHPKSKIVLIPKRGTRSDVAAEYGAFAETGQSLHALSGRHDVVERTRAMSKAIFNRMDFQADQRVLDIGCGDATLLRNVAQIPAVGVGTVLTDAERDRLASDPVLDGITFIRASFDDLTPVSGPFDRIVANGCIHFVRTRVGAERALRSIAALMPSKAKAWIGELHANDCRRRVFGSKRAALHHVHRRYGTVFTIAFARFLWRRRHRADLIVEPSPADWWHVKPDAFVDLAERCGFRVEGVWPCIDLTGDTFYRLQDRYSCLLIKR